jgi:hypothetical protein
MNQIIIKYMIIINFLNNTNGQMLHKNINSINN